MKKFTTIKTLLVGLLALGATSAWADGTTIYERGTSTDWTNADLEDWPCDYATPTINGGLTASTTNGGWTCTKTISSTENSIITLTATIKTGGAPGRSGSYDFVKIGGVGAAFNEQDKVASVIIDDVFTSLSLTYNRASAYDISIQINQATGAVNYTIGGVSGTATTATAISSVTFGHFKAGRENYAISPSLISVSVFEEVQTVSTADYTVKYVCDGEEIKEAETRTGVVGTSVSLFASDIQPVKVTNSDDVVTDKYIYVSDDAESASVSDDGNTVVTVTFRKAVKYSYTAKNTFDDVLASGSDFEGETANYYWAAVLNVDGTLYTAPAINSGYKGSILLDEDNKEALVEYTASEDITTLVYLAEGEDVFTKATGSAADTRGSMGAGGCQGSAKSFVTLPAGKYIMVVSNRCTGDRTGIHVFTAGTGANAPTIFAVDGHGYNATWTSEEFTLTANTDLYFQGGSENQWVDYLYIYKTGDVELPENVTVEVTGAGWGTLYTDYALNFEGTGLTAYTATLSESTVTLTEVTSVTAGTGVVLKGEAKTYEIPVINGSDTAKGDLKGNATADTTADGTQYVLVMNGSNAQFTKATSGSIDAGKAYLEKATESESRILNVVFAGEATGIKAIETVKADGSIYNMAGQRVAAPQKGFFIMNGKKVIIK